MGSNFFCLSMASMAMSRFSSFQNIAFINIASPQELIFLISRLSAKAWKRVQELTGGADNVLLLDGAAGYVALVYS